MRPTGKALQLLSVTWLSVLLSFLLLRWDMIYLTLPILTLFFVAVLFFKPIIDVKVERVLLRERVLEGEEVEITVRVRALARIPFLFIRDELPEGVELVEGSNSWVLSLAEGEEKVLRYRVRVRRGIHEFRGFYVAYRDPFGLFEEERFVDVYGEIVGVPRLEEVITPYSTRGTKVTVGPLPSPRVGEGVEFHAVREYQPGDPFKIINWKATARTGKIMANEFESERKVDVIFVVDATYKGEAVFDYLIRAAASLMLDSLNNGTSFGLLLSESVPLWIGVDYGKRHFFRCIDALSAAKPDKNNMIAYQVDHLARTRFPPRAQILYFSPLITEEGREALRILYLYGYRVVVISPNPCSLIEPRSREEELALKLLMLERKAVIRKLSAYGPIIDWDVRKPLKTAIAEVLR
ncbi:DUF58 domain-containing protein [Pyrococcus yayanosii]|uniref:DUF58 domain-containing protein n=1 Tax=Pyrococcus yayanosii (strain CH1 / JCM 16557) TaxID=529709 RepID=F8AGL0_PYRYC|nr:hypothetical protein PYCH_02840 [Pyrococcus yayanosii CH1]